MMESRERDVSPGSVPAQLNTMETTGAHYLSLTCDRLQRVQECEDVRSVYISQTC